MRDIVISTVNSRRYGTRKLNTRNRNCLSKSYARQIAIPDSGLRHKHTQSFSVEIKPGYVTEAKGVEIVIKRLTAERERHIRKTGVAAIVERFGKRLI